MNVRFLILSLVTVLSLRSAANESYVPKYDGYLFVYFTGGDKRDEAIRFALSKDGLNFTSLNDNAPVVDSRLISETGGVRDPHILRTEDGKSFYMVVTDMVSANGWDSNRGLILMKSDDLIHWSSSAINIQKRFKGNENLLRVWAPQTIYDNDAGKYMVYWSMKHGDGPDIIYYAYANDDFTDFVSKPKPLFIPKDKKACIDGDIIYKDGLYHLFYKTEGNGNGIKKAVTEKLTSGKWKESPDYKHLTKKDVEGSGVFKLNDSDKYILMYDVYRNGEYMFTESADLDTFKLIDSDISMDFHPRHGTVMSITAEEYDRLLNAFPSYLKGVKNPVLPQFHADPEILYSRNTGKYYIYSTTDGYKDWGGSYFTCYSSDDLKDWHYEGVVLDVATDQVPWADGNAWAPAIEEKKIGGKYKYFLYFSANNPGSGRKQIGVAVADKPTGPFKAVPEPIITSSPAGRGQQIDVDVFTDPVSTKAYLYWGNGYMAGAELNADMLSVNPETIRVMTPEGGTLNDYRFREAAYVLYRDGIYYFLWSVDDTRSPNYHVAYGTSTSPLGPITVADNPVILSQNKRKKIYGTAHNSVLQLPESDDWIIVYHRMNPGYMNDLPGIHREVCIDRLLFNEDGSIIPVTPN
ncbi:family 43 glycosylhydrolase [uncultured Muribaculum sp.]|uniref:family 43 glycosylhydrolase n=1 Tax=uncultured Muribaculum sp. TaxID=1918613 RepID=UPI002592AF16|nr:family 43 glycosylhydrolase [uncultured Muribaculum sp.]